MPTLVLLAGPNGAGRTTFINGFLRERAEAFQFVNPDGAHHLFRHPPASRVFAAQIGGPSGARERETPTRRAGMKIAFGAAGSPDLAPLVGG